MSERKKYFRSFSKKARGLSLPSEVKATDTEVAKNMPEIITEKESKSLRDTILKTAVMTAVNPLEGKKKEYVPFLSSVNDSFSFKLRMNIFYFSTKPFFRTEKSDYKKYFTIDYELDRADPLSINGKRDSVNNVSLFTALKMSWLWVDISIFKRYGFKKKSWTTFK